MEPPVSVPIASGTCPAATEAALPPLDPPGVRVGSCGLRVAPNADVSVVAPMANSSRLALPTITPPAALIRRTSIASRVTDPAGNALEPQVIGMPRTATLSFTTRVLPASTPMSRPSATARSSRRAVDSAPAGSTCSSACTDGSVAAMTANASVTSSTTSRGPAARASTGSTHGCSHDCSVMSRG